MKHLSEELSTAMKRFNPAAPPPCDAHDAAPDIGYLQAAYDAAERLRKGERQWLCAKCQRWVWETRMKDFTGAIREDIYARQQRRAQHTAEVHARIRGDIEYESWGVK